METSKNDIASFPEGIRKAHEASFANRADVESSRRCGCFYCLEIFEADEVEDWAVEDDLGRRQTALCPYCGIDSVLGDRSGFPITPEFLAEMEKHWFGLRDRKRPAKSP